MGIHGYCDAAPARRHLATLRGLGWTYEQIEDASGVSARQSMAILRGEYQRVRRDTQQRCLTVSLAPVASHRGVDSAGTRRRVQALAWMGWPNAEVAVRAGTTARTLATLIPPSRQISFALSMQVKAVYDELSGKPGPSKVAARKARELGHAPPAAWDDESIDNPKARPRGVRRLSTADGGGRS